MKIIKKEKDMKEEEKFLLNEYAREVKDCKALEKKLIEQLKECTVCDHIIKRHLCTVLIENAEKMSLNQRLLDSKK